MNPVYGLIFDVDGVVADTEAVNARASIKVFADLFRVEGVTRADFEAGLGRGAEEYVKAAARIHGLELTEAQVAAATRARQENFLALLHAEPLPPFPGVLELMNAALSRDSVRLAIATSSVREKSEAVLVSANIPYDRMIYVAGSDVTCRKPDPEIFLLASDRMGVDPARCVVIEDAPDGVAAARAAGCRCVAVTNSTSRARLAAADLVVDSLIETDMDGLIRLVTSPGQ